MHTYEVSKAIFLDDLLTNVSANGSSLQWHAGHCQSPKTFSVQIWAERSEKEHVSTIHSSQGNVENMVAEHVKRSGLSLLLPNP